MKKYYLILSLFLLPLFAYTQSKRFNKALTDSLAKWVLLDQTAAGPPTGRFKEMTREQRQRYKDSVFVVNERRLMVVFDKYGFPGSLLFTSWCRSLQT
jgi:hypothetical protein